MNPASSCLNSGECAETPRKAGSDGEGGRSEEAEAEARSQRSGQKSAV